MRPESVGLIGETVGDRDIVVLPPSEKRSRPMATILPDGEIGTSSLP